MFPPPRCSAEFLEDERIHFVDLLDHLCPALSENLLIIIFYDFVFHHVLSALVYKFDNVFYVTQPADVNQRIVY